MPVVAYSYRLRRDVPLLIEDEWADLEPLLQERLKAIKELRDKTGWSLDVAREWDTLGPKILDRYEEMSGVRLARVEDLQAVRMSAYGALCKTCGKPFRTPKARKCMECGNELPAGQCAGPLSPTSS